MLDALREALTPFLWGGALALFLNLPLCWVEARLVRLRRLSPRWRRGTALLLVLAAVAAVMALGLWLLIPQLWNAAAQLTEQLPALADALARRLMAADVPLLTRGLQGLDDAGKSALTRLLTAGVDAAVGLADKAGTLLVSLVLAVYFLADRESLARRAVRLLQAVLGRQRAAPVLRLAARAGRVFARFAAGQCVEAVILAGLFVVAMSVFRMPNVLPIATVIGFTALVPVFGSIVGCAVGVVLILPYGIEKAGWFVVLFLCLQQLENNLVYPHVVGSRIGLPPLWVLAAVLLGGSLFGVTGLLLGIPAMSVVYHVGSEWVRGRLQRES